MLLWLEVEDEVGETEKSGDGLEKLFWLAWRKFWCSCWFEWPTTNRLLAADCGSFANMDERLLPTLIRGWNATKCIHITPFLTNTEDFAKLLQQHSQQKVTNQTQISLLNAYKAVKWSSIIYYKWACWRKTIVLLKAKAQYIMPRKHYKSKYFK